MHASIPVFFLVPTSQTVHFARGKSHKLDLNMLESWWASSCDSLFGWSTFLLVLLPGGVGMIPILSTVSWWGLPSKTPRKTSTSVVRLLAGSLQLVGRWNWRRGTKLTWFVSERHWFTHIYLTRDSIFFERFNICDVCGYRIPIKGNQKWRTLNQNSVNSQTHTSLKSCQCSFEKKILRVSFFSGSLGSSLGYQGDA